MRSLGAAVMMAAFTLLLAPASGAETVVGGSGPGAGQFLDPRAVAVDRTGKLLYVVDRGNNRIDVFGADDQEFIRAFGWGVADGSAEFQSCTTVCLPGLSGSGPGQFKFISGVAVDNDPASPTPGAVYVEDSGNARVQKFSSTGEFLWMVGGGVNITTGGDFCAAGTGDLCGVGADGAGEGEFNRQLGEIGGLSVGPGGTLHVGDQFGEPPSRVGRVQKFTPSGAFVSPALILEVSGGSGRIVDVAVASNGDFYAATTGGTGAVRRYDSTGACLNCADPIDPSFNIGSISIDTEDSLFVGDLTEASGVLRFDDSENQLQTFYGLLSPGARTNGIAAFGSSNAFVSEEADDRVLFMDFPPPGPVVYPVASATFANPIGNVRATLNAKVNPEGKATTFHFEYVEQATFEAEGWASTEVKESAESASIGSDFKLHAAQAQIGCADPGTEAAKCLIPSTAYRFRVVAANADGTDIGPDATFETKPPVEFGFLWSSEVGVETATLNAEVNPVGFQTAGHFELVTEQQFQATGFASATKVPAGIPLDFGSGEAFVERSIEAAGLESSTEYRYRLVVENNCKPAEPSVTCVGESEPEAFITFAPPEPLTDCPNTDRRPGPAVFLPGCRGYEMVSPVDKDGTNVEVVFNITGFRANLDQSASDGQAITYSAYKAFPESGPEGSPYSSQYISRRGGSGWTTESISPPREGPTLFNSAGLDYQFKAFTSDLCYGWFLQDTARPLLDDTAIPDYPNLYRRDNCGAEQSSYMAITGGLPSGDPQDFVPQVQGFSADGSRTFFGVQDKLTPDALKGQPQTYEFQDDQLELVCELPSGKATACGLGSRADSDREGNVFNAVSESGDLAYWAGGPTTSLYLREGGQSRLIADGPIQFKGAAADGSRAFYLAGASSNQLHEYDLDDDESHLIANGIQGVAGMSSDASVVYFVSTEVLAPGATAGIPNLYHSNGGVETLVTTLGPESGLLSPTANPPVRRTSRVTPDGSRLVFMSRTRLTGYDNTDTVSKEADAEVFLYDAEAEGGVGELVCVSCNPSGARPTGGKLEAQGVNNFWAAAWIPTWTTQLYAPRVVSDDGTRVFFNSFESLVSNDENDAQDVYQWEALGSGTCKETLSTYVPSASGCLSLISSGQSSADSEFVDSSASGDDVFFKTYSSLASKDSGLLDIYDARTGGGTAAVPPPQPECQGEACLAPPPPAGVPPTPSSATFVGPGNVVAKPKPKCRKGTHRVKRKGKVVCVKNKKKGKAGKNRRAGR